VLLDVRAASRKTPLDGKFEVSADAARRLQSLPSPFPVALSGAEGVGVLSEMPCSCARAGGGGHLHHFVTSDLFRSLVPERRYAMALEGEGIRLVPADGAGPGTAGR
jgi:hypothetical protein